CSTSEMRLRSFFFRNAGCVLLPPALVRVHHWLRRHLAAGRCSELQKIYILTNSMGWKLEYNGNEIKSPDAMDVFKF
ncbi:MAG: hypothetical protein R6W85_03625, partial [Gillisia sp.]